MVLQWFRKNSYASLLLTIVRIYLGWEWMTAGWHKLTGGAFDAKGFLLGAVKKTAGAHPTVQPWWGHFLNGFAVPNVGFFNFLVPWGEFLVGIGLLLGVCTTFAALMGIVMNFAYLFSGTTSTNPQMLFLTIFVLIAGANAGKIGLDYYVLPYMRKIFGSKKEKEVPQHSM